MVRFLDPLRLPEFSYSICQRQPRHLTIEDLPGEALDVCYVTRYGMR
jgi:hypothetical protein